MMSVLCNYFNPTQNCGHFLPNLLKVDIAIMMYDRILHLTTVVAIVMTVWARSAVTHRVFSAWLHPLRGEGCASGWGLPSRHFRHLQSGQLPWSEPLHHLKGWVIYLAETWCAKETENVILCHGDNVIIVAQPLTRDGDRVLDDQVKADVSYLCSLQCVNHCSHCENENCY